MKYETIEDLKRVEGELAEFDKALDHESNAAVAKAIGVATGGIVGAGVGGAGGLAAVYFGGTVAGISGPGIMAGLAWIGGLVGAGAVGGIVIVAAAPVALAAGGAGIVWYRRRKKFEKARIEIRSRVQVRRDLAEKLIRENGELGESLDYYRAALTRLNQMITDLG